MPRTARSFADDIRRRTPRQLHALLERRGDLTHPAPADLTGLAARAATRASVQRALDGLEGDLLHALEAVLVAGTGGDPAALLGTSARTLTPLTRELWLRGLLWHSPEGLRPARAVGELLTHPAELGPPASELGDPHPPADVDAAYRGLSAGARRAVDRLRWSHPSASFSGQAAQAVLKELTGAGLMARTGDEAGVIPREVGIALRGGILHPDALARPEPHGRVLDRQLVDESAGAEATELLWQVEELAAVWEADPPRVLRSGGLSVRDHRLTSAALETSSHRSAFVIEVAAAAGLVGAGTDLDPTWLPTTEYDSWVQQPPADRWAALAAAWWSTVRAPSLAGTASEHGVINVLSDGVSWPLIRRRRHDVLDIAAQLPEGMVCDHESVDELLRWHRPLRLQPGVPTHAETILREAGWLGLTGRGALSSAGRALARGADLAAAMRRQLPEPVHRVVVQSDLTAVAPGPLTDELRRFMRTAADVESRGGATVFRFTPESLRRAMDRGLSADALLARLHRISTTPVPQPLEYLVRDVARRHGQVRLGAATCYVRSDDDASLSAMTGDPQLATLQLRRVAPTVLVSPAHPQVVLGMLREQRYAPVIEAADGTVVTADDQTRPRAHPRRPAAHPVAALTLGPEQLTDLVSALRHAEARPHPPAASGPRIPTTDPTVTLTMLQDAAAEQAAVWIGYVDGSGELRRTLFTPHRVDGGRATGTVDTDRTRTFSIHRITGVAPA